MSWVVLLRGINLGATNRVPMAELRDVLGPGTTTVLRSGNAVTPQRPDADAVRAEVLRRTGTDAPTTVLSADELRAIADACPLEVEDPKQVLVLVLGDPVDAEALRPLADLDWSPDTLAVGDRAAYLDCPEGVRGSKAWRAVERATGRRVTARNWATVQRLLALL